MRGRSWRRVGAVAVAAVIGVGAGVQPAHAEVPVGPVVQIGFAALKLLRGSGGMTAAEFEKIVTELVKAVTAAKIDVLAHIDQQEAAEARGNAEALSIDMLNYAAFADDELVLGMFASRAITGAERARAHLDATTNRRAADQIGQALNTMYLYGLTAMHDGGYSIPAIRSFLQNYIAAEEQIVQRLAPECTSLPVPGPSHSTITWLRKCTAATGREVAWSETLNTVTGEWIEPPRDENAMRLEAAEGSSWLTARTLLPDLRRELAGL